MLATHVHQAPRLRMIRAIFLLSCMLSWRGQEKLTFLLLYLFEVSIYWWYKISFLYCFVFVPEFVSWNSYFIFTVQISENLPRIYDVVSFCGGEHRDQNNFLRDVLCFRKLMPNNTAAYFRRHLSCLF